MFEDSLSMKTSYLMEKSLNVESQRRKVIANNIANVDVPHFKRSEVNFESQLKRVIRENSEKRENAFPGMVSDSRHIPFIEFRDVESVNSRVNLDYSTTNRNDGNNVDIEKEVVDASKNLMRYNAMTQGLMDNFRLLKMVMRSAG